MVSQSSCLLDISIKLFIMLKMIAWSRYRTWVVLSVLIPFLIVVGFVVKYGVNVPVTDQYALIPLFQKIDHHTLSFADVWQQHNEHRVFFPNIWLLTLATITHWDIRAEIGSSLIMSLVSAVLLALFIYKTVGRGRLQIVLTFITCLWFFSPVQWQNWLWGWQVEWYMCICASLLALWFVYTSDAKKIFSLRLALAIIAGVVASYSLASGLFIWVVGLVYLVLLRRPKQQLGVWSGAGVITAAIYFIGYVKPDHPGPLQSAAAHPAQFIEYFFAYLGRPISNQSYAAILFGVLLLVGFGFLVAYLYRKKIWDRYAIWLTLALYALIAGAVISASRIDLGIINAMSSRYTAFSSLFIISMTVVLADVVRTSQVYKKFSLSDKRHTVALGLSLITILVASGYYNGFLGMRDQSALFRYIYSCTRVANPDDACLFQAYFPSTKDAKTYLDYLKQKHYGGY